MCNEEKLVLCGNVDETKVYMEYGAYLKILRYAKAGSVDGARGVLLGTANQEGIHIQIALEALYTGDEGLEAPSFTKESWDRIGGEIKSYYPDMKILGQYSTHADISANEMDYAMQESFFPQKNSLLFTFDPIDNTEAVYVFDKNFRKLQGMYLYDRFDNDINLKLKDAITRPVDREYELRTKVLKRINHRLSTQNKTYAIVFGILLVAFVYLILQNIEVRSKFAGLESTVQTLEQTVTTQEMLIREKNNAPAIQTPVPEPTQAPKATATPRPTEKATPRATTRPN